MNIMMYLHSGSLNRGCEALARSTTQVVRHSLPESKLFLSSFLPESDKHLDHIEAIYDMNGKTIEKGSFDYLRAAIRLKLFKDENFAIRKSNEDFLNKIPKME